MANETVEQIKQYMDNHKGSIKLTEREIKIIMIKYIIHGVSPFHQAPLELRVKMLMTAAAQFGLKYDDAEWQNLGLEILTVHQIINDNAAKFLQDNKDLYNAAMRNIKDGNDALITVCDSMLEGQLKKMVLNK